MTDAGTPGVSDPGVEFVKAYIDSHIPVDSHPWPQRAAHCRGRIRIPPDSADNLRVSASSVKRQKMVVRCELKPSIRSPSLKAHIEFLLTLSEIGLVLGERQIMLARELTKVHQEFLKGSASVIPRTPGPTKGRNDCCGWACRRGVLAVDQSLEAGALTLAVDMFGQLTNSGSSRRAAMTADRPRV